MAGYDIFLSNGDLLTAVNVKTVDERAHSSLILIGQGVPNYGADIAQNFVWLLENFAKPTAPPFPLIGQHWYDDLNERMNFYTGTEWHSYLTPQRTNGGLFDMLPTAQNINFAATGTTPIFTGPDVTKTYLPTFLILIPTGTYSAVVAPTFNLLVSSSGDVMGSIAIPISASTNFVRFTVNTQPHMVQSGATVSLRVTAAATGGQLHYNAYLFGFTV